MLSTGKKDRLSTADEQKKRVCRDETSPVLRKIAQHANKKCKARKERTTRWKRAAEISRKKAEKAVPRNDNEKNNRKS
jgi:hypothetical protein